MMVASRFSGQVAGTSPASASVIGGCLGQAVSAVTTGGSKVAITRLRGAA